MKLSKYRVLVKKQEEAFFADLRKRSDVDEILNTFQQTNCDIIEVYQQKGKGYTLLEKYEHKRAIGFR